MHMGASILYPHRAEKYEKIGSELTGKFLQNDFFHLGTYFLSSESNSIYKILQFPLGFAQNGLWSVPNKQNP